MTAPPEPLPRVVDNRPARRPGGARGAPFPDLPVGASAFFWLRGGSHVYVEGADDESPARGDVPWEAVDWWIPIEAAPAPAD